jgi:hypothetical protein
MQKIKLVCLIGACLISACNSVDTNDTLSPRKPASRSALATQVTTTPSGNSYDTKLVASGSVFHGISAMAGDQTQFYFANGYNDDGNAHKQNKDAVSQLVPLAGLVFKKTQGMAVLGDYLYFVENGYIVRVQKDASANNAAFTRLGSQLWDKTQSMTASASRLYLVHNDRLYEVDPNNVNGYLQKGSALWKYTGGMTYNPNEPGYIYIVENGSINKVRTSDGVPTKVGDQGIWQGCRGMTYLNGSLYLLFGSNLWRVPLANPNARENINRDIPTCCGSEAVRNAITTSGNSIFYWAAEGWCPTEQSFFYSLRCAFTGGCYCSGSNVFFIVKVTPL